VYLFIFKDGENRAAFIVYDKKESRCDGDDIF